MEANETGLGTESHVKVSSFLTRNMHTASEESIALLAENSILSRTIRALVVESDEAILRLTAEVARTKKLEEDLLASTSLYTELFNDNQLAIDRAVKEAMNEYSSKRTIEQMEKDEQDRNNVPVATRIRRDRHLGTSEAQRKKPAKAPPTTEKTNEKQTEDDGSSDDDFSSDSDNDKVRVTPGAPAKAKTAKAKKTDNATARAKAAKAKKTGNDPAEVKTAKAKKAGNTAAEAKAAKAKADSEKPNPLSAIRPSTSDKQGGVSVFKKPRVVTNVTK
jgi:membrane protein involved in colicin uptake